MSTCTAISRMLFIACVMFGGVKEVNAWVKGFQPFPEEYAIVLLHRFCLADGCPTGNSYIQGLTAMDWSNAIRDAAETWNAAGSDFIFSFQDEGFSFHDPCQPAQGYLYVILTAPGRSTCPGDEPLLSAARINYGPGWARVYINAGTTRLQLFLLHEFGHAVGLGHPDEAGQNVEAVMNGATLSSGTSCSYGTNGRFTCSLLPDDIAGIRALYGGEVPKEILTGFLENPGDRSSQSGVGIITGWVCEADEVVIEINGVAHMAAYGTERLDTAYAPDGTEICGDTNNGFSLLFNWNLLRDGEHTVVAFVNGIELGRATVTVRTFGEEFLEGATGRYVLEDFPTPGRSVTVEWDERQQNFVIDDIE